MSEKKVFVPRKKSLNRIVEEDIKVSDTEVENQFIRLMEYSKNHTISIEIFTMIKMQIQY